MAILLAVLIIEDSESDTQLIVRLLKKAGYQVASEQVETAAQMRSALQKRTWDVVISDYSLPQFDGRAALELLKETGQDIPFIVVSGAIGEESAVDMMKAGAHDYLMKGDLARLAPAVARELEQAQDRRRRKQADQELRESEAHYRAVTQSANDAIISSDSAGIVISWNGGAESIFGYSAAEAIGLPLTLLMPSGVREDHIAGMARVQAGGRKHIIGKIVEMEGLRKDGSKFPLEFTLSEWQVGEESHYTAIMRDITERKQGFEALHESEENYRLSELDLKQAQSVAHLGNWKWNLKNGEVTWSDEMYRIFGIDKNSYTGRLGDVIAKVIHPDDLYLVLPSNAHEFAEKKPVEYRIILPDQSIRYIWAKSGEAILDDEGNPIFLTGIAQDITERKQAEAAIRESEERLAAVIEGSQLGYSDWNIQTGEIQRNERWATMLGYTLKEIETTYHRWEGLIHPEDRAAALQSIQDHLDGKTAIHRDEYRLRAKDGSYVWVLDHGKIVKYDSQGQPLRMTATHTDITERKHMEEALRKSEERYAQTLAAVKDGLWEWHVPSGNAFFSVLYYAILGYEDGAFPATYASWRLLVHPQDLDRVEADLRKSIESDDGFAIDLRMKMKSGDWRWVSTRGRSVERDAQGGTLRMVGTLRDITERKQVEEALSESEKKFRNLVWDMQVGVILQDSQAEILLSNPKALELLGISEDQLLGMTSFDPHWNVIHEDGSPFPGTTHPVPQAIVTRQPVLNVVMGVYHPIQGDRVWLSVDALPQLNEDGSVRQVICSFVDITRRIQAEKELRESEDRFRRALLGAPFPIMIHAEDGEVVTINTIWTQLTGYQHSDIPTIADWTQKAFGTRMSLVLADINMLYSLDERKDEGEYTIMNSKGETRTWEFSSAPIGRLPDGRRLVISMALDITERKLAEDQLRQLSHAVEYSPTAIIVTDVNGKIEYVNPKFISLTGYTLDEVRGQTPNILKSGEMSSEVYTELWQTILAGGDWRGEFLNRKKNGELYWEYASISAITDSKGNITHFVSVDEDITNRKVDEEKLKRLNAGIELLAMTDYLTSLYNRRYFMQRGVEECKRASRNNQPLALLMLDIDEFKNVNDTYGHAAGDMALQQVAAVLKSGLREIDILGRIGGEEFAVLLPNTLLHEAVILAERIHLTMAGTTFEIPGDAMPISLTICIGVATFTEGMSGFDNLLRNADSALYDAKNSGRNQVKKYKMNSNEISGLSSGLDDE